jgi:predicted small lipoprotein YifL
MRLSLALVLALTAAGCGQTGPLYLPDKDVETPVEIRGPAPQTEPKPEEEDEDEKATQPPGR